ncbi:CBS domain-containing protein [Actinocorallia sp. A-T 12471]|uniref:CBS domain-containing protein n=1 Tax=Actinocorallia sp. A-T 12471 TaxID=3089813 RepID=UPI0029D3E4EE|nr:CBS domain-containing protein [Actinocorallia sp. A-T 12471]MDX6740516.1 CBS domain-containing protein [Actinocorallia sp. A-T 12471]
MRISDILRRKGHQVATVSPDTSVRDMLAVLAEHKIGAVVVMAGPEIAGIASERDVVRSLHERGADALDGAVASIMTRVVHTCAPTDHIEGLRPVMTELRIRHVPVLEDGRLTGIVSIGDVVKSAIDQLETEREALVDYLQS